jgi:hypothetical protein
MKVLAPPAPHRVQKKNMRNSHWNKAVRTSDRRKMAGGTIEHRGSQASSLLLAAIARFFLFDKF